MKRPVVHVVGAGAGGLVGGAGARRTPAPATSSCMRRSLIRADAAARFRRRPRPRLRHLRFRCSLLLDVDARFDRRRRRARRVARRREAGVAFADLATGERWRITPGAGRLPWWLIDSAQAGPELAFRRLLGARRLLARRRTRPSRASRPRGGHGAALAPADPRRPQLRSGDGLGAPARRRAARRPRGRRLGLEDPDAEPGVRAGLVEPLARSLERDGAALRFGRKLVGLGREAERVACWTSSTIASTSGPPTPRSWRRRGRRPRRSPGTPPPEAPSAALTIHFAAPPPSAAPPVVGVLNGPFDWLFARADGMSVAMKDAAPRLDAPRDISPRLAGAPSQRSPVSPTRCRRGGWPHRGAPRPRRRRKKPRAGPRPARRGGTCSWPEGMSDGTSPTESRTPSVRRGGGARLGRRETV